MKYKLIACDMDGTLISDNRTLSQRNKNAIIKAIDAGVYFVVATGRPYVGTKIVSDLFEKDIPFIVLNGAAVCMSKTGEIIHEQYLDFDLAKQVYEIGEKKGLPQIVWTGPTLWANRVCDETIEYEGYGDVPLKVIDDFDTLKTTTSGISKVLWIDDPEKIRNVHAPEMSRHFGNSLNHFSSMLFFLEFVSIDTGKGPALKYVGEFLGISRDEMVAIGDSYNDISMLDYAGYSVVVDNAPGDIKRTVDHITSSNNDDGVAEFIENFVLNT